MKIGINARFLLKGKLEGIGWYTFEVLRRLVEAHPEQKFVFFFDRPFDPSFVFAENVQAIVLRPPARHPVLWYLWFEWALPAALKKQQIDVFFSPDSYLSLRTSVPTVMVVHDIAHLHFPQEIPFLVRRYYEYFIPRFLRKAERVIAVSEYTRQDVIKHYAIPAEKIVVGYNGCKAAFQPLDSAMKQAIKDEYTAGEDYFFYVGAIHPRKNVHRLIAAFDQFKSTTASRH